MAEIVSGTSMGWPGLFILIYVFSVAYISDKIFQAVGEDLCESNIATVGSLLSNKME